MTQEHPITPPPELVQQWASVGNIYIAPLHLAQELATQAARWGADQELEACCEYLTHCAAWEPEDVKEFCDLRRPKPPSLKQQALALIDGCSDPHGDHLDDAALDTIRRAVEALPDD